MANGAAAISTHLAEISRRCRGVGIEDIEEEVRRFSQHVMFLCTYVHVRQSTVGVARSAWTDLHITSVYGHAL